MAIRRRPDRKKQYQVYWNNPITGKRESESFATLAGARKHDSLIAHNLKHEREQFIPPDDAPKTADLTFGQLFPLYLADKKFSASSLEATLFHIKPILKIFSRRVATSIERKEVVRLHATMVMDGVTPSTSHRRISILRAVLSWAVEKELIDTNPLVGMKLSKGDPKRYPPPSIEEAAKIMAVAPSHLRRTVAIGIHFGVRVGESELFSIRWDNIDFDASMMRVWSAKKNPKRPWRDLHLPPEILEAFLWWGQEDSEVKPDTIIHWRGKSISSIKTTWKNTLKNAKIGRYFRPYDLRHAFATLALQQKDPDIKAVADIMGHSDATMILRTYQHVLDEKHKAILDSMPKISGTFSGHISEGFSDDFSCVQSNIKQ